MQYMQDSLSSLTVAQDLESTCMSRLDVPIEMKGKFARFPIHRFAPTEETIMTGYLSSWAASVLPAQLFSNGRPDTATDTSPNNDGELSISKLVVYPIKSCAGVEVQESPYSITGLDYDRQWMLVDIRTKKMITARNETHAKVGAASRSRAVAGIKS